MPAAAPRHPHHRDKVGAEPLALSLHMLIMVEQVCKERAHLAGDVKSSTPADLEQQMHERVVPLARLIPTAKRGRTELMAESIAHSTRAHIRQ